MTFTEFEKKQKRYRNNKGKAASLLGPLIIIIIIITIINLSKVGYIPAFQNKILF